LMMIHDIGSKPYSAPCTPDSNASPGGILYTTAASTMARVNVSTAARYAFIFLYSAVKMNTTGIDATRADSKTLSKGSMVWVHCIPRNYDTDVGVAFTTSTQCFGFTPVKCSTW